MFLAEGEKIVRELLISKDYQIFVEELFATEEFYKSILRAKNIPANLTCNILSDSELKKISKLTTPNKAVLLMKMPQFEPDPLVIMNSLSLVLEDIQDPGNLGTIIRTAAWFNIRDIFCSPGSVDVYNPKVIQSTMGAFCRVRVHYKSLFEILYHYHNNYGTQIAGTSLHGTSLQETDFILKNLMIVFGNESRGISDEIKKIIEKEIKIPSFHKGDNNTDSLNIASAAAIICWEFMRRRNNYSK